MKLKERAATIALALLMVAMAAIAADEITVRISLKVSNTSSDTKDYGSLTFDQATNGYVAGVQNIGTSAEALGLGGVIVPGWAAFKNLDTNNYVEIGYDDSGFKPLVKLKAGEVACFRLTQSAPQARANTAAINLEYRIYED